jgi:hypothetical protein
MHILMENRNGLIMDLSTSEANGYAEREEGVARSGGFERDASCSGVRSLRMPVMTTAGSCKNSKLLTVWCP